MPPHRGAAWDNLDVLRGLNSESVNLVYADAPFNSNRDSEAPIKPHSGTEN